MLENCVKAYLNNADADADPTKVILDIDFCGRFFGDLEFYSGVKEKLEPQYVAVLRESGSLYSLDWEDQKFQTCLILEKHAGRDCDQFHACTISMSRGLARDDSSVLQL